MCGIVALFSPRGTIAPVTLERATHRLVQRGPDSQRTWVAGHGRVGLGYARLSIIDLHTGDQPIESADGRIHIVVNGEMSSGERTTANQVLMVILSACALQERYHLT